jgi:hypothetical protein
MTIATSMTRAAPIHIAGVASTPFTETAGWSPLPNCPRG